MSQQKPNPARSKPRRATAQSKAIPSNRPEMQKQLPVLPAPDDREGWRIYWEEHQQPWRTEPEIDEQRQSFLAERLSTITPNIERGVYPFKGIRLKRADLEWLLATHEGGRGPIDWHDPNQQERQGVDLRGAYLQGEDLRELPLAHLRGGLLNWSKGSSKDEWLAATPDQRESSAVHLEGVNLAYTHLEGAILCSAHLEGARLHSSHLEGARLREAHLEGTGMNGAYFDRATNLFGVYLSDETHGSVTLADVRWGEVNLSWIDWSKVKALGNERRARQRKTQEGLVKDPPIRLAQYLRAVRENRRLAVILREQGLTEEADYYAYRAQNLQRWVLWHQRKPLKHFASWVLWGLAGYGYKPLRSLLIYLVVLISFATSYLIVTHTLQSQSSPLTWYEALVLSVSSFHGRGFFQSTQSLGDPVTVLAALEAIFGLLIEISFIATFTQRFFGR